MSQRGGYILQWPAEAIWEATAPLLPGFTVEVLPELDSTNSELMRRAHAGQLESVLLVAQRQTAGRGRLGRQWFSGNDGPATIPAASPTMPDDAGAGASLTFSLGLALSPAQWSGLSLAVGLSLVQSLHPDLRLKWPNDLWWQDRKLGGVLIETVSVGEVRYAVIGVGINIAARDPAGLAVAPAALVEVLPGVDASAALQRLVLPLVRAVLRFAQEGFEPLRQTFHTRDVLLGRDVICSDGVAGTARGVDATGALLVHTENGVKKISSAEVSVRLEGTNLAHST